MLCATAWLRAKACCVANLLPGLLVTLNLVPFFQAKGDQPPCGHGASEWGLSCLQSSP